MPDLPKPRHAGADPVPGLHRETPAAAMVIQAKEKATQQRHEALDQPFLI